MKNIIITGAAGYIGSHTLVELGYNSDYNLIAIDDYSNSSPDTYKAVENITGKRITRYPIDLNDYASLEAVAARYGTIDAIIHFAASKSVPESVTDPLKYYRNNTGVMMNLLELCAAYCIPHFIFSSSCAVYGNIDKECIDETTPTGEATSPYARTKQAGEYMLADFAKANSWFTYHALRYFNPAGCHISGLLGETSKQSTQSLVPLICRAVLNSKPLVVFGNDYNTIDGTCIRDYVHVCDIARAHELSLKQMLDPGRKKENDVFNLGAGKGYSVLQVIAAFEKYNLKKVPYTPGTKREGDIVSIYASNTKAKEKLGWTIRYSLEDIVKTAWTMALEEAYYTKDNYRPEISGNRVVKLPANSSMIPLFGT